MKRAPEPFLVRRARLMVNATQPTAILPRFDAQLAPVNADLGDWDYVDAEPLTFSDALRLAEIVQPIESGDPPKVKKQKEPPLPQTVTHDSVRMLPMTREERETRKAAARVFDANAYAAMRERVEARREPQDPAEVKRIAQRRALYAEQQAAMYGKHR